MVNIEVDVENFVELLSELLDGQDDVVDVAKARRLENQTSIFRGHFHSCDSSASLVKVPHRGAAKLMLVQFPVAE